MKKILTTIAFVFAITALTACSLFQGKSIDGEWTSPETAEEILAEGLADVDAENLFTYSDHRFSEVLTGSTVDLSIVEDQATMTMTIAVDREAFFTAMKDETSAAMKSGLEEEGINYDELDDDLKALYDEIMLSDDELYRIVDQALGEMAKEMDGSYDEEAGHISTVIFKGSVDRSKKAIQITEVNATAGHTLEDGDLQAYTLKDDNVLILEGDQDEDDMVLKLKK